MTRQREKDKLPIIIEAAKVIFACYGFHDSHIAKIAKQAGIAEGTIYLYVRSKEELMIRLFEHQVGSFIAALQEQLRSIDDARAQIRCIIQQHLAKLEEDPELARVFQFELRQPNLTIREGIAPILRQYFQIIEHTIRLGQQQGHFDPTLSAVLVRKLIFGGINEVATSWVFSQKDYSLRSQGEPLLRMILKGITT
ncbi:TetR family transcriptional regulator [Heliobacterium gestii]|uniref:TetR family transcriptional regulator n=1 Tax=Heliomicrobium gestii TaxID=2699 RepID=A0A845LDK3_HELGE|nr:TetR/AcrR family transcriptional regulator [Heliomicrobium gestii]MBM7867365.1 TetR/AcrR family fatty acid metabolism transcriptional regulator [Heliomicrobium gestii]MZP43631.1 TetR family transcriptional regulator [Heliomicrobium gestii]